MPDERRFPERRAPSALRGLVVAAGVLASLQACTSILGDYGVGVGGEPQASMFADSGGADGKGATPGGDASGGSARSETDGARSDSSARDALAAATDASAKESNPDATGSSSPGSHVDAGSDAGVAPGTCAPCVLGTARIGSCCLH